jgi:hypothetical protein
MLIRLKRGASLLSDLAMSAGIGKCLKRQVIGVYYAGLY